MPQEAIRVLTEAANRQIRSLIKARDGVDRPELLAEIDQLLDAPGSWLNGPSPSGSLPQLDGAGGSSKDGDAAIALHRSLSGLTRVEASDSRLWNALGLTTYRNYIEQRWGDGGECFRWTCPACVRLLVSRSPVFGGLLKFSMIRF